MRHDHKEAGNHDNKRVCRSDGCQLSNGVELVRGGACAGSGKNDLAHRILADTGKGFADGATEAGAEGKSKEAQAKRAEVITGKIGKECENCRVVFYTRYSIYCSRSCSSDARTKKRLTRICETCGKASEVPACLESQKYCSVGCRGIAKRGEKRVLCTCQVCDGEYYCKPFEVTKRKYCSTECYRIARQPYRNCDFCKARYLSGRGRGRKFCSMKCWYDARASMWFNESTPTRIEIATYEALDALRIEYKPQEPIGRFVVDAYIPSMNMIVECQGDYWHCNPEKYPDGPTNSTQRGGIERDKRRFDYFKRKGFRVVELWESDIKSMGAKTLIESVILRA
jgi:very-short-patch-repair endonuclease